MGNNRSRSFTSLLAFIFLMIFWTGCGNVPSANKTENTATPNKFPMLGAEIADADLEMVEGGFSKVSQRKGNVVLLNLWATWCMPCIGEMPGLVRMQDDMGGKGLQIIGLNVGDDGEPEPFDKIKNFAKAHKLNYELARITPELGIKLSKIAGRDGIPQSFLIDREGRLRGTFFGGSEATVETMRREVEKVVNEAGDN